MMFPQPTHQPLRSANPWLIIAAGVMLCTTIGQPSQPENPKVVWPTFAQEIPVGAPASSAEAELPVGRDLVALRRPDWEVEQDVERMALSPDGNTLMLVWKSKVISLWDLRTGKRLAVLEPPGEAGIYQFRSLAFSADGALFAAGEYGKIHIFDARTGRRLQELADPEKELLPALLFAPGNNTLVAANAKGKVRIWDLKKAAIARTLTDDIALDVFNRLALALSPDGKTVAFAAKQDLIVADVDTGEVKQRRPLEKASRCLAFSPDGKHLAVGREKSVEILSLENIKGTETAAFAMTLEPTFLAYSPSGKTLVAACEFGDVYLFNPQDEKQPTRYHIESWGLKTMIGPVFSGNGKTLIAAGRKTIRIWDFEAGPYERRMPQKRVWAVAGDGRGQLLAVAGEGGVAVYDGKTGAEKHRLPDIHAAAISLDPTGKFVAYRHEGPAEIYDLEKNTSIRTGCFTPAKIKVLDIPRTEDQPLLWSPDGKTLAGGESRRVKLFQAGKPRILGEHRHNVLALAYAADGKHLASGGGDGKVMVWDLAGSSKKWEFDAHEKGVKCLGFSADGALLASGGGKEDPSVSIWDLVTGKETLRWNLHEGSSSLLGRGVTGLLFSPDRKYLAVTRGRTNVEIYDAATGKLYRTAPGHNENMMGADENMVDLGAGKFASFEAEQVLLWSWDRLLSTPLALPLPQHVRPTPAPPAFATLLQQYPFEIRAKHLTYSPDGKVLAMRTDKEVHLVNPANGQVLHVLQPGEKEKQKEIYRIVFRPDSKMLAVSCEDKSIRLYDVADGKLEKTLTGHNHVPIALTFALDGTVLVAGNSMYSDRNELFFWDVQAGTVREKFVKDETKAARALAAFPDGKVVAALCDGKVHLWDVMKLTIIKTFEARKNTSMLAVSADGKKLACAEYQDILGIDGGIRDAKIWVWDVDSGKVLATFLETGTQNFITFGPDGSTIFTVGGNLSTGWSSDDLQAWDLASGKARASLSHFHQSHNELFGSSKGVAAFAFAPDGKTLATYSKGLRFWNAADLGNEPLQKGMSGVIKFGGDGKLKDGMLHINVAVLGRLSAAVLDHIADLPYPVSLTLRQAEFMNDGELARLRNAANIKHLDLTGAVFLGDAGAKHVAALTGLETLKLDAAQMTDAGLEHLHQLRNLKKLYLFESGCSLAGIEKLKKATPGVQVFE